MHENKPSLVTDPRDPRFQALRTLQTSQGRSRTDLYLIEGIRHLARAVEERVPIESVFLDPSVLSNHFGRKLAQRFHKSGVATIRLSPQLYRELTLAAEPQGIGAVLRQQWIPIQLFQGNRKGTNSQAALNEQSESGEPELSGGREQKEPALSERSESKADASFSHPREGHDFSRAEQGKKRSAASAAEALYLGVESIDSPGNLGTIIRTAEAAGVSGIFLLSPTDDPWHPAAVRASMGSLFSQTLVKCSPREFTAWARSHDIATIAASPAGLLDYKALRCRRPAVLLVGSEKRGLSEQLLEASDFTVRIPMRGRCDSLNVAVATGVLLFELSSKGGR